MRRHLNLIKIPLMWLLLPLTSFALPNDSEQPIHITANYSTFNYNTQENIYEGNVTILQGSTRLTADRFVTKISQKQIQEATAYGIENLAEYTTLPKKDDEPLHAEAKSIKFHPLEGLIILEGNVKVIQGKNSFHGPLIIYNMKKQLVTAPASKEGRTTITIEPNPTKS